MLSNLSQLLVSQFKVISMQGIKFIVLNFILLQEIRLHHLILLQISRLSGQLWAPLLYNKSKQQELEG